MFRYSLYGFLTVLSFAFLSQPSLAQTANHVVISEVQIGRTGAVADEFVELYNPTDTAIDLSALQLKLHIRSNVGTDVNKALAFTYTSIPSRGFFLIGSNSYVGLSFDATYSATSAALISNGGVYISTSATASVGVIDMVGWGTQPSGGYEGTACPDIPADQSIQRKPGGGLGNGTDTDNNSLDFLAPSTTTTPMNSSDPPVAIALVLFNVSVRTLTAYLHWSTATETNNYGFEIERRSAGSNNWSKAGFVSGSGTSSTPHEYTYLDTRLAPGRYVYRLKQIDNDGAFTYYGSAEVEIGLAAKEFRLESNYPNPFNPSTTIQFTIGEDGKANLKVFNILGQDVATLFDAEALAGRLQQVKFDGSHLPSGLYFARLEMGKQQTIRKMMLLK